MPLDTRARPQAEEANNSEQAAAEDYRELLKRLQADFVNYKRRVERERQEQAKSAAADLILKLLPLLDDLGRALKAVPHQIAGAQWVKGMALVERKLMGILEEQGLRRMEAEGEDFDPWQHEAVFCEEAPDLEEGKVKAVLREGYTFNGKVIRPAQVTVTKKRGAEKLPTA